MVTRGSSRQHLRTPSRRQILDHQVLVDEVARTSQREHQARHGGGEQQWQIG